MSNSLFWKLTLGFCVNNILVSAACIIQVIYTTGDVCKANEITMAESLALLSITILLSIISSYVLFALKTQRLDKLPKSGMILVSCLWLIQYGLIVHSFVSFCDSMWPLHLLFFIWMLIYSIVIFAGICGIIIYINKHFGWAIAIIATFGIILFLIAIFASVIQLMLITSGQCQGAIVGLEEGIFLLMLLFSSVCFGAMPFTAFAQDYIKGVLCALFTLLAFQYGLIIRCADVWGYAECGEHETLRKSLYVFFMIWTVAYSLILFVMCCGALLKICGQIQSE
eukprot:261095_1